MKRITSINYQIQSPNGSIISRGCIRKYFHGAFKRMQYLKVTYGSLIKFNPEQMRTQNELIIDLTMVIARIKKNGTMELQDFRRLMEFGIPIHKYISKQGHGVSANVIYDTVIRGEVSYGAIKEFLNTELCKLK